jgi:polyhydroxyalkanoate synthesis repressor PhaR
MKEMEAAQQVRVGSEPKTIKRYANRKLYDTAESRYVTLDEIATMVKQGVEVRIVDNRTKEDLTSITLAQIIFEEEKKKSRMPLSLLREIIRQPSELISGFIQKEVTPRVTSIREEAESRLDKLLRREEGGSEGLSAKFEDWQRRVDERVKQGIESVVGNLPALGRDFQQLKQRLEELEKKVDELERGP